MNLNLSKAIVFFDIESTGINVANDRIVEISLLKVYPDGKEEKETFRVNPGIPIRPEASKVHGIKDEDVKDLPGFKEIAPKLGAYFKGADIAGYNSNKFDIPMLDEEFHRAEYDIDLKKSRFVDVQVIFFKKEQRTLSAAYKFYCEKKLKNAHSAEADTVATYEILKAQLDRYSDLKNDIKSLSEFTTQNKTVDFAGRVVLNDKNEKIFNFGKHKGKLVSEVFSKEPSYYKWMMDGDFPQDTKRVITAIYTESFNSKL